MAICAKSIFTIKNVNFSARRGWYLDNFKDLCAVIISEMREKEKTITLKIIIILFDAILKEFPLF